MLVSKLPRLGSIALLVLLGTATSLSQKQAPVPEDPTGIPAVYQQHLQVNPQSSLTFYQIAEMLCAQRRYQASANACRAALRGDGVEQHRKAAHHQSGTDQQNQRQGNLRDDQHVLRTMPLASCACSATRSAQSFSGANAQQKHGMTERWACRLLNQLRGAPCYRPTQLEDEDRLTQAIGLNDRNVSMYANSL